MYTIVYFGPQERFQPIKRYKPMTGKEAIVTFVKHESNWPVAFKVPAFAAQRILKNPYYRNYTGKEIPPFKQEDVVKITDELVDYRPVLPEREWHTSQPPLPVIEGQRPAAEATLGPNPRANFQEEEFAGPAPAPDLGFVGQNQEKEAQAA